jgi:hypothetical protein
MDTELFDQQLFDQQLILFGRLLKLQARLFGMQASNQQCGFRGESMAYNEDDFRGIEEDISSIMEYFK